MKLSVLIHSSFLAFVAIRRFVISDGSAPLYFPFLDGVFILLFLLGFLLHLIS